MTDLAAQFLREWIQASVQGETLGCSELARQGQNGAPDWSRVIHTAEKWKLIPLLYSAITRRPWFELLPISTRLLLEERMARSRLIHAATKQELDTVLSRARESQLEILLLGQCALSLQYAQPSWSDERAIPLGVRELNEALRSLARQGYRGVGFQTEYRVELQHRKSLLRVQLYSDLEDETWRRSTRSLLWQKPVRKIARPDLSNWFRREIVRNEQAETSPRILLQLSLADPSAKELRKLSSVGSFEKWFGDGFDVVIENTLTLRERLTRMARHFLLVENNSETSEDSRNPAQDQERQQNHRDHGKER